MNTPRRLAAAVLAAALSLGTAGAVAGPAEAKTDAGASTNRIADTTWPG